MTWVIQNGIPNHCAPNTKRLGIYTLLSGTSKEDRVFNLKHLSVRVVKQFDTIDGRNPQPVARLSHYYYPLFACFFHLHPTWCRISSIKSMLDFKESDCSWHKNSSTRRLPRFWVSPPDCGWKKTGRLSDWNSPLTRDPWPSTPPKNRVFIISPDKNNKGNLDDF